MSSSSSECMCPDCFQCDASLRTFHARGPFCQALCQPLIYYAQTKQTPQFCDKKCKDSRKCRSNGLVKAFRWYTQEHKLKRSVSRSKNRPPGLSEFAMWIDKKYAEFLKEKQNCECSIDTPKNVLSCDSKKTMPSMSLPPPCDSCQTNFFARVRSPWRKHRSKERTSNVEKHLQSLEFILEPKEFSRPASECCQRTPPKQNSIVSAVTSESQISKKMVIQTRTSEKSLSYQMTKAFEINRNDGLNIAEHQEALKSPKHKGSRQYCSSKDISCQCPETKLVMFDAQTQYYDTDVSHNDNTRYPCNPTEMMFISPSKPMQTCDCDQSSIQTKSSKYVMKDNDKKRVNISCQCSSHDIPKTSAACQCTQKYRDVECHCALGATIYEWSSHKVPKDSYKEIPSVITRCVNYPCKQILHKSSKISNNQTFTDLSTKIHSIKVASKDTALQTSDNAIDLVRDGVCKYPLFMKIVYAENLK